MSPAMMTMRGYYESLSNTSPLMRFQWRSLSCDLAENRNKWPTQDPVANVKQIIETIIWQIQAKKCIQVNTIVQC